MNENGSDFFLFFLNFQTSTNNLYHSFYAQHEFDLKRAS